MVKLVNRAYVSTATTGTGTITLGSPLAGQRSFADAGVADGDTVRYIIEDGNNWEIGTGAYTASGTTLSRTVSESSNSDAAINLSGNAVVYISAVEADFREERVGTVTGNATLDLSTGNVFSHTPTADTTFVFSNPPASGTAYGMTLKVTGANVTVGYDLANASYDSVSFSVVTQDGVPEDLFFSTDGSELYVLGQSTDFLYQYTLSTAWDVSTASLTTSLALDPPDRVGRGMFLSPDGLKFYFVGAITDAVQEYDLSTAWDISTASLSQSFSISAQDGNAHGLFFKSDGTKMYVLGDDGNDVNEYDLSTAWDVSTASYVQNFSVGGQESSPKGLSFKSDGSSFYMCGSGSDTVYEYVMSTPWDISTASLSTSFSVASQDTEPTGVQFKPDGTKMYIIGNTTDTVYQYTTSTSAPATITYPTSVDWPSGTAPDAPADGETDVLVFYTEDGGTTYYGFQAGDAMA